MKNNLHISIYTHIHGLPGRRGGGEGKEGGTRGGEAGESGSPGVLGRGAGMIFFIS